MYLLTKRLEIAGAHRLNLPYESKCTNIHGHNWYIMVYCKSQKLNEVGMIIDFKHIKNVISDKLDHAYVNDVIGDTNPTAEYMAEWILNQINEVLKDEPGVCYRVDVQESEGNTATYIWDEENVR